MVGLFHIGIELGFSDVLDQHDIPVYMWKDGKAKKVNLDSLNRTPLVTIYLRRNNNGENEDRYHLCYESFDYSSWKATGEVARRDVYVDILNRHGEVVWRMEVEGLEPVKHQVVWDGFSQPGMYDVYVKGMPWDAESEMVI